jgi:heptosyltransferase-2
MALPAIADVQRRYPSARLVVAARPGVADLFAMVPIVSEVIRLEWRGELWRPAPLQRDAERLRQSGAALAILFPNSFASAWLVSRAGIPERWGYARDLRRRLLTRVAARERRAMHQAQYYQSMLRAFGIEPGPLEPPLAVPQAAIDGARTLLAERGWDGRNPLVVLAPGAAYGKAKQWLPAHVVRLVESLTRDRNTTCVLVGSRGDAPTTAAIRAAVPDDCATRVIDLAGATSLEMLAGVLAASQACVVNDSGAMHLAAAVGAPVVALFGPTIVEATRPLPRAGGRVDILTHRVWCRPCMLRECPIDHRCMRGITPQQVLSALEAMQ